MSPVLVVRLSLAQRAGAGSCAGGGGLEAVEDFFGHLVRRINLTPSCLFATGASLAGFKIVIATYRTVAVRRKSRSAWRPRYSANFFVWQRKGE